MATIPEPGTLTVCKHIQQLAMLLYAFLRKIIIMPDDPGRFLSRLQKVLSSTHHLLNGQSPGNRIFILLAIVQDIGEHRLFWPSVGGIARTIARIILSNPIHQPAAIPVHHGGKNFAILALKPENTRRRSCFRKCLEHRFDTRSILLWMKSLFSLLRRVLHQDTPAFCSKERDHGPIRTFFFCSLSTIVLKQVSQESPEEPQRVVSSTLLHKLFYTLKRQETARAWST